MSCSRPSGRTCRSRHRSIRSRPGRALSVYCLTCVGGIAVDGRGLRRSGGGRTWGLCPRVRSAPLSSVFRPALPALSSRVVSFVGSSRVVSFVGSPVPPHPVRRRRGSVSAPMTAARITPVCASMAPANRHVRRVSSSASPALELVGCHVVSVVGCHGDRPAVAVPRRRGRTPRSRRSPPGHGRPRRGTPRYRVRDVGGPPRSIPDPLISVPAGRRASLLVSRPVCRRRGPA